MLAIFNAVLIDRKHAKNSFLVNISDISEICVYEYIILNRISIKKYQDKNNVISFLLKKYFQDPVHQDVETPFLLNKKNKKTANLVSRFLFKKKKNTITENRLNI